MTRFERRLFYDTALLGLALTLLVVIADYYHFLTPVELWLDNNRARLGQNFRPPPTDKLVFVDIDDTTLADVGIWPWSRQKWAAIIHELHLAGAKTVGLDIMFPEAQGLIVDPATGATIDPDAQFAAAIAEFSDDPGHHGVLAPFDVTLTTPVQQSPVWLGMIDEYSKDLETDDATVIRNLKARGIDPPDLAQQFAQDLDGSLRSAMFKRIQHEWALGHSLDPEALRAALLPRSSASGIRTAADRVLAKVIPKVVAYQALLRFSRPYMGGLPPLLEGYDELAPIPSIARAAQYSGFVTFRQAGDSKVRFIPMWILDRGRLVPQFSLALACATLGVDTNDLKLAADSVTIPFKNGQDIVIPVHTEHTKEIGDFSMVMDIPWFGGSDWKAMYDYPKYRDIKDHVPLTNVWDICQIEPEIVENDRGALNDVAFSTQNPDLPNQPHPAFDDADGWIKLLNDAASSQPLDPNDYKDYLNGTRSTKEIADKGERDMVEAYRTLINRAKYDAALLQQRQALRDKLKARLLGKTILVGYGASGNVDIKATPIHTDCPGVDIHGVIFNAIITNYFIHPAPEWVALTLTAVACLLTAFAAARLHLVSAVVLTMIISAIMVLTNFYVIYDWGRTEVDAAGVVVGPLVVLGVCTVTRYLQEYSQRKKITSRFSSYVDPSLVNYFLENIDQATFSGEDRELSVVFTDLAGFTSISELLKKETVPLLNKYLGLMVPVVSKNHGLVNKFLGDGIMFFFGAPEAHPYGVDGHALAAVECILEMQQAMIPFNKDLIARNLPTLKMRAGVSTGEVTVGDAGNPPARSDYTVLGDRVNFASRLESANKYTGTLVLISDRTVELLNNKYLVRQMGRLQVVGKKEPVMTYEPICPVEKATDEMHKLVRMTQSMVDAYIAAQFVDCMALSHELLEAFGEGQAKFCQLYRHLCAQYLEKPPEEFLGQIILESK